MTLPQATRSLNRLLKIENPSRFSSSWIFHRAPHIYRFITKNVRTEVGYIDWDKIISSLDRKYQKRWYPIRHNPKSRTIAFYRSKHEVNLTLKPYRSKRYVFAVALNQEDRAIRDAMTVSLVRIAQKGNTRAEEQLLFFLDQVIQIWIETYPCLRRWAGQREELDKKIRHCIYYYRFTGTFLGYLFKTLEYSAWGLQHCQSYSLDSYIPGTTMTMLDTLTKDPNTGRVMRGTEVSSSDFS